LVKFVRENQIDLTVVGPEAPLVAGLTDELRRHGLAVFGPSAAAARLEGSKVFTKKLLKRANIPTATFSVFSRVPEAMQYLDDCEEQPLVVKADGLAAGKGVFVCANLAEARTAVRAILQERAFGEAGSQVVIEECLVGQEASILAIVDGDTIVPLDVAQDHKRAYDNDQGPNTGGMGAYCPAPVVTPEIMDEIVRRILIPTVHTMKVEDCPFSGVLYAGIMLTSHGPKVLEFNVRFGDPEAQPVLMRMKSDLAQVLMMAATGKLSELEGIEWDPRPAVCVVMASEGYPGDYSKGHPISGIAEADKVPGLRSFTPGRPLTRRAKSSMQADECSVSQRWVTPLPMQREPRTKPLTRFPGRAAGVAAIFQTRLSRRVLRVYSGLSVISMRLSCRRRFSWLQTLEDPAANSDECRVFFNGRDEIATHPHRKFREQNARFS
jgi:phosphoribosylamine--glycine ligase